MKQKNCKHCNVLLNEINAAKKNSKYYRNECKACRVKVVNDYRLKNKEKRNEYMRSYLRKTGKVKQYPCEYCQTPCFKIYALAVCSVKCRFMAYVEKTKDCWMWTGGKNRRGYGKFNIDSKFIIASRAAYLLFKGELEENKLVCHTCDNPPCVNPDHLWLGTNSENQQDSIKKGRHRWQKKENLNAYV